MVYKGQQPQIFFMEKRNPFTNVLLNTLVKEVSTGPFYGMCLEDG